MIKAISTPGGSPQYPKPTEIGAADLLFVGRINYDISYDIWVSEKESAFIYRWSGRSDNCPYVKMSIGYSPTWDKPFWAAISVMAEDALSDPSVSPNASSA